MFFIIGFVVLGTFTFFNTMKLMHSIIHGKSKKIDASLMSDMLGGSILFGLTISMVLGLLS